MPTALIEKVTDMQSYLFIGGGKDGLSFPAKFISGEELNAAFIGVTASVGVIFALFTVLVIHKSEKSRR